MEKAAEYIHIEWMKRNPKADYNAAQHVPYNELDEVEKEKDRVHVRTMSKSMGKVPQQGVAEAPTDDPKFQKMMGAIQKNTPDPVSGYVAVSYASERPSKKIKGATVNGRALPATTNDPGQLIKDLEFTPDRIEQQLTAIGQENGWDLVDPGQGQGYSELYFDTNKEFTTHNQTQLAAMIVKTVAAINKYFSDMNRSLQATGLPAYQSDVWQGMGANGNTNQIDDINQIENIARGKAAKAAKADPGQAIGQMILDYLPEYEAENDELKYDPRAFKVAKDIANTYITQGERAGLKAQGSKIARNLGVSEMIDELLSDHNESGLRTVWDLDKGLAEGYDEDEDDECHACRGTGEGQFDGQSCPVCRGTGVARPAYDDDDNFDVPDDYYESGDAWTRGGDSTTFGDGSGNQWTGGSGGSGGSSGPMTNLMGEASKRPFIRKVEHERADGTIETTYELLDSNGRTIKTGMSKQTAMSVLKRYRADHVSESIEQQRLAAMQRAGYFD
jgi:hypothetical protein